MSLSASSDRAVPAPPQLDGEPSAGKTLLASIVFLVAAYAWLFVSGSRFLVLKTAIMPIFLVYALTLRRREIFLTNWMPILASTVLFDALRGAIFVEINARHLPIFPTYAIALEQKLFGTPAAPLVFQQWRTHWLDLAAVTVHASHFAFFLLFGLVLWHLRPTYFGHYRRALVLVMAIGLLGYVTIPTVPPWLAFQQFHLLPPIAHTTVQVYTSLSSELYGTFDTNPVAAMPSLHAAFPSMCAFIGWHAYGRRMGLVFIMYSVTVMAAVMYLGEHYAVDVVAGVGVALLAVKLAERPWGPSLSFRRSIALSIIVLGLTFAILQTFQ